MATMVGMSIISKDEASRAESVRLQGWLTWFVRLPVPLVVSSFG